MNEPFKNFIEEVIPELPQFATFDLNDCNKEIKNIFIDLMNNDKLFNIDEATKEILAKLFKDIMNPYKNIKPIETTNNLEYFDSIKDLWFINGKVDANSFANLYKNNRQMYFYLNSFYDINGLVDEMQLKSDIIEILGLVLKRTGINANANELIEILKVKCDLKNHIPEDNIIHVKNATLLLKDNKVIVQQKKLTINRLNIDYTPWAKKPVKFFKYLNELFTAEEIVVLQEYLGYILVPTLKAQKSLLITGEGGEGKSVLLDLIKDILEGSFSEKDFTKMFTNTFGLTNVEGKLLICDDDMPKIETKIINQFKKLVTLDTILLERKNKDEKPVKHFARFIGLGNNIFSNVLIEDALIRRLLVLEVKPKAKDRIYNRNLLSELLEEKEAIFNWMLEGLFRLINNDFNFSYEDDMSNIVKDILNNPTDGYIHSFIKDTNVIELNGERRETTKDLYEAYTKWHKRLNKEVLPLKEANSIEKFQRDLARVSDVYNLKGGITFTDKNNERHRGYIGIGIVTK